MPIMMATHSTNKIIVTRKMSVRKKRNEETNIDRQTHAYIHTNKQSNKEKLEEDQLTNQ